jgi:alkanesulfonate monooxygenase SsuD/methylene tetrahydromethanopterin reductase-like flavin-dependent oxidoreductase (luciferase family)
VGCQPEELAALRRGGSDAEAVLTDRLVDQFSLSGTLDDCLRKIQQMGELGITHVTLIPATKNPVSVIETFGREVLPRFA